MVSAASNHHRQAISAGYFPGMRQPARHFSFHAILPPRLDLAALDRHLAERFLIAIEPMRSRVGREAGPNGEAALAFTWRAMQLASGLLQAMKVPSFDPGFIIGLSAAPANDQGMVVTCALPVTEGIDPDLTVRCMKLAYRMLFQLADATLSEAAVRSLLEELNEKFIEPAAAQIAAGTSTIPLLESAFRQDMPFRHLGAGVYQLGWGARMMLFDRSACSLDSAIGAQSSHNKQTAALLLRQAGLPVPEHQLVRDVAEALEAASTLGFPVVVKPADRDRGQGVTVDVVDEEGLRAAFEVAFRESPRVLIERQAPGLCHRLLVVGDHVLYTVARLPKLVDGDGVHTVRQLVDRLNDGDARQAVHWRKVPIVIDADVEACLNRQGLGPDSVLSAGQRVFLRRIENHEWGGTPELVTTVHPDNVRVAVRAARLLGLHGAGIDMISSDISRPWYENQSVINEVNYAPLVGRRHDYQRASLDTLIRGLFPRPARIPVEAFVGDQAALDAARHRQGQLIADGVATVVTTHEQSWGADGALTMHAIGDGLLTRCRAMLADRSMEVLLLVIQTDEPVHVGMPVDRLDRATVINDRLHSHQRPAQVADEAHRAALLKQLAYWRKKSAVDE